MTYPEAENLLSNLTDEECSPLAREVALRLLPHLVLDCPHAIWHDGDGSIIFVYFDDVQRRYIRIESTGQAVESSHRAGRMLHQRAYEIPTAQS